MTDAVVKLVSRLSKLIPDIIERALRFSRTPWLRRVSIVVVALALALLLWTGVRNWDKLSEYDWELNWAALGLSSVGYTASLVAAVGGWSIIMRQLGCRVSLVKHWKVYTFTNVAKRLPSALWYASGRVLMYDKMNVSKRITSISLVIEILVIVYTGAVTTALLSLFLGYSHPGQVWTYVVSAAFLVVIVKPQWTLKVLNKLLVRFGRESIKVALTWRDAVRWMPVYLANWACGGVMLYWLIRSIYALDARFLPEVIYIWTLSGVVATLLTSFLPLSIGPRELTLTALLTQLLPLPVAVTVALGSRVWIALNQFVWFALSWIL